MAKTRYWHELTDSEVKSLGNIVVRNLKQIYKQPNWCELSDATGFAGCWALVGKDRRQISPEFCKDCEFMHQEST